jgi:hypothetical protein
MFLTTDLSILSVRILKKLLKWAKIKNHRLKKSEMVREYNKYLSALKIQKVFRKYFYRSAEDHITFEKVEHPCFIFQTKSGKCYFYSYESIVKYIMKTGDTRDPMTRTQYSDELLTRLDTDVKKYIPHLKFKSTLKIKKNPDYARRIRNRENEILNYQTRIQEIRESIIIALDSDILSWTISNILIDNVEYLSPQSYVNSIIYELKILLRNLTFMDQFSGSSLKTEIITQLNDTSESNTKTKILELIN